MSYVLGIDIGSTSTTAAVVRLQGGTWAPPEAVRLAPPEHPVPSVLLMSANRALTVGDPDEYGEPIDSGRVARGFSRRIGDEVPLLVGGEACSAQALTAMLAMWVVERVVTQEGGHPEWIVLSHPAGWGSYRRHLLHDALWEVGLADVTLLPAPITAAESHAAHGFTGHTLAVYALGGNSFEPSVVGRARPTGFELRGCLADAEPLGGADFDEALVQHVRAGLGRELADTADPLVRQAVLGLRRECTRAKAELTAATTADVLVRLPRRQARVPVTRAEFEELIRPAVRVTVDGLTHTVRSCGLAPEQLDGVLLVGGSARIPLVRELLAAQFPVPVEVEADPQVTIAAGAALAGCQVLDRRHGHRPPPRPPVMRPPRRGFRPGDPSARPRRGSGRPDPEAVRSGRDLDRYGQPTDRYADESPQLPPRPPIRITPLELPMRVASRLAPGNKAILLGLAVLALVVGVVLTVAFGPDALTKASPAGPGR